MRYFATLYGTTLGDPVSGVDGAEDHASRYAARTELAFRYGYDTWEAMVEDLPFTRKIQLQPLEPDPELDRHTVLLEAAHSMDSPVTDQELNYLTKLAQSAGYADIGEAVSSLMMGGMIGRDHAPEAGVDPRCPDLDEPNCG